MENHDRIGQLVTIFPTKNPIRTQCFPKDLLAFYLWEIGRFIKIFLELSIPENFEMPLVYGLRAAISLLFTRPNPGTCTLYFLLWRKGGTPCRC